MNRKLGAAWKSSPSQVHVQKCTPGAFPAPGWAVVAWLESGGGVALRHAVLDQSSDALIASLDGGDTGFGQMDYNEFKSLKAIDLDGDGIAEILEEWVHDKGGHTSQLLSLYRVDGKSLQKLLTQGVGYDNSGAYTADEKDRIMICEGSVVLRNDLALVIDVKLKMGRSPNPDYQCSPGHHVFKMVNGKMMESK